MAAALAKKIIFVLGGPGAGKGTVCSKVAKKYNFLHLSAGDLLREAQAKPTHPHSELIREYIREGKIVPREITISLLKEAMEKSTNPGFLIDGFPRAVEQAEGFEKAVRRCDFVLFLDCSEEIMEERIMSRTREFQAANKAVREDDNLESLHKRFKVYHDQSVPVVEHYGSMNLVRRVDAGQDPAKVFEDVVQACNAENCVSVCD
mmetsp:Transcript_116/g.357  ORF Transcript_116/g.357 Transcript_116/m.357 type:complete len:205 (+) Transcript_116:72-686(+)